MSTLEIFQRAIQNQNATTFISPVHMNLPTPPRPINTSSTSASFTSILRSVRHLLQHPKAIFIHHQAVSDDAPNFVHPKTHVARHAITFLFLQQPQALNKGEVTVSRTLPGYLWDSLWGSIRFFNLVGMISKSGNSFPQFIQAAIGYAHSRQRKETLHITM